MAFSYYFLMLSSSLTQASWGPQPPRNWKEHLTFILQEVVEVSKRYNN